MKLNEIHDRFRSYPEFFQLEESQRLRVFLREFPIPIQNLLVRWIVSSVEISSDNLRRLLSFTGYTDEGFVDILNLLKKKEYVEVIKGPHYRYRLMARMRDFLTSSRSDWEKYYTPRQDVQYSLDKPE